MTKRYALAHFAAQKRIITAVAAALCSPWAAAAQPVPNAEIELAPIAVTANPLGVGSDELVTPVSILNGRELSLRRESTLGETLKFIPGVSSSYFGPNASRPVIRGLDGDRVRMMQNGVGILDASSLSFDHAVALDPLIIEQIDVVRGPAALLYGGSAVGGVVNAIDHRIPKEAIDGVTGRGEIRLGGAENQKNGAIVVDAGNGLLTIHADAYQRKTDDLDIPGFAVSKRKSLSDGTPRESRGRLVNSSSDANGGALGASIALEKGYAGISYSTFNNNYGTVAEPGVRIDQNSDRWDFASELRDLGNVINRVKVRMAHTDYQHQELENGEVGTTFKNRGMEGSIEAGHGKIGKLSGVVGVQFQNSKFQALGEEAFVPSNRTLSKALYVYEELPLDFIRENALKLSFGGRTENVRIESAGGGQFGPADEKSFRPNSFATGALYTLNSNWSLASNLSHNERAPSYFELLANGPHLATGQFEVGNDNLSKERSNGIDGQVRWKSGNHSFSVGAYYTRFSNFISLANTGNSRGIDGELNPIDADGDGVADGSGAEILPEATFMAVPAIFKGIESEGKFRVYDSYGTLDLNLRGDYVRATNRDTGDPLPRISPLRLGFGLDYKLNRFGSRLDVLHAFKQDRTAANELATDGYTLVNAMVTYRFQTKFHLEAYAKANNLLNQEIREHTSFLKDIAPLGGRALLLGLRGEF
ncbi:MAG TPA: TonB-dependent receptor [Methylophilaceae bacterium]|nr:TonB-dependent receptor [Methylophilaceae bacterium]